MSLLTVMMPLFATITLLSWEINVIDTKEDL